MLWFCWQWLWREPCIDLVVSFSDNGSFVFNSEGSPVCMCVGREGMGREEWRTELATKRAWVWRGGKDAASSFWSGMEKHVVTLPRFKMGRHCWQFLRRGERNTEGKRAIFFFQKESHVRACNLPASSTQSPFLLCPKPQVLVKQVTFQQTFLDQCPHP